MLGHIKLNRMPMQLNDTPLFCGFYFNELLMRLLHKEDPHPKLYDSYHHSLCRLEKGDSIALILRMFEKKLLEDLGYGLPLQYEAKTRALIQADLYYQFIPNLGFILCNSSDDTQMYFSGRDLMYIAAEQFDSESAAFAAKRLMRGALSHLLGNKPLNSRELF